VQTSKNSNSSSGWADWLIAAIALLLIAAIGGTYYNSFADYPAGGPPTWGEFGDYFGGVANPILGLATVILVVLTLRATRKAALETSIALEEQLKQLKTDARLKDLHRRIEGAYNTWNDFVESRTIVGKFAFETFNNPIFGQHKLADIISEQNCFAYAMTWQENGISPTHRSDLLGIFFDGMTVLLELAEYCDDYDRVTNDRKLTDFYRRRVERAIRLMKYLKLIDVNEATFASLNPGSLRVVVPDSPTPASQSAPP